MGVILQCMMQDMPRIQDLDAGRCMVQGAECTVHNHNIISQYRKKTPKSARMFAKSRRMHINGVSHNIRFFEPYPFVVRSARGRYLADVDGNRYTDYWMGHWSLILGHARRQVRDAVQRQLGSGWMHGTVNEATMGLSAMIQRSVKAAEKIRYVTSGTEATMYATRLARSVTGRKKIAKIEGGWHGYGSDLLRTVNWPFSEPESGGVPGHRDIISIPYNDLQGSLDILARNAGDLAGVIVEPLLGGGGCIPATREYLEGVQEFVHHNDSLFILDEIVTGFRFRYGCLYPTMRLDPDIVTLGKIIGGGFPIGVICGTDDIMRHADTSMFPKADRAYVGGGTFSANPVSMTAGSETLAMLKKRARDIYPKINRLGCRARSEIAGAFDGKVVTTGMGSLFMTHFVHGTNTTADTITNARDAFMCDADMLARYHFKMIVQDGIFFLPGKLGAISDVHSDADISKMIRASQEFAQEGFNHDA